MSALYAILAVNRNAVIIFSQNKNIQIPYFVEKSAIEILIAGIEYVTTSNEIWVQFKISQWTDISMAFKDFCCKFAQFL